MIAFLLLLVAGLTQGQDADEARTQAAAAYRDGRYEQAYALYRLALSDPPTAAATGPLLYNTANCAFRLERYPEAILLYRRALLRMPLHPQATFNLKLAEQRLGVAADTGGGIASPVLERVDALPPALLLVLACALQCAGLLGIAFAGGRGRRALLLLPVLVGLLLTARLAQARWYPAPPDGVVLEREIGLRTEPHREIAATIRLRAGETVRVAEWSDRWMRVVHPAGSGWTERAGVGLVD